MCQKEVSFFSKLIKSSQKKNSLNLLTEDVFHLASMPTWNHRSCQKPCQAPGGSLWADEQKYNQKYSHSLRNSNPSLDYDMTLRFLLNHSLIQKVMMGMRFRRSCCESQGGGPVRLCPLSMTLNHQILLACNVSIVHLKPPPQNSDPCKESTNWMVYKVSQWLCFFRTWALQQGSR